MALSRTDGKHARAAPGSRPQARTCRPSFWRSCSLWGEYKPRERRQAACRSSQSRPNLSSATGPGLALHIKDRPALELEVHAVDLGTRASMRQVLVRPDQPTCSGQGTRKTSDAARHPSLAHNRVEGGRITVANAVRQAKKARRQEAWNLGPYRGICATLHIATYKWADWRHILTRPSMCSCERLAVNVALRVAVFTSCFRCANVILRREACTYPNSERFKYNFQFEVPDTEVHIVVMN